MKIYYASKPDFEWVREGKLARLTKDFHFWVNYKHYVIMRGFEWDGASIPKLMRWKYGTPFDKVHLIGGLVHDAIYANVVIALTIDEQGNIVFSDLASFTRFKADNIYFAFIRMHGAVCLRAFKEWAAVRFFGFSHWYNYKKGQAMKTIMKILGAVAASLVALVVLAGCKSISFERINGENIVRGSYYAYGIENNLEGLEIIASPTNGVTVRINRSVMDMSDKHEKIVDASGKTLGTAVGAAAATMVK